MSFNFNKLIKFYDKLINVIGIEFQLIRNSP